MRKSEKMTNEKKKKIIVRTFIMLLIAIVLLIGAYIANEYIVLDKNKTVNLVINNKNVTENLKNEVLIENGIIYLSKQDIANFFDKYIYEEKDSNKIITTYRKKIAEIGYENNTMVVNGASKKIYANAMKKGETIYLPISEMKDVYELEVENIENAKVVTLDSTNREQKKAIATGDLAVKSSKNFISKTVDRIKKGEYVVVVDKEDNYTKIRTLTGKIGYIDSDKLANEVTIREDMEDEKQVNGKINMTWDYYSEYGSAPKRTNGIEGINVVSPSFFYVNSKGEFKENVGQAGKEYVEWAHKNGYKVWPMVSNAGTGMINVTSQIMNSYEKRQKLIESIVSACVNNNVDGINVDFENMKVEDKELYSRFIIELTPRMKEAGLVTSVDVTAPDGGETWSMCYDRHIIGNVADYIVFMAYDQYGASSTKAGTTAGYNWVELSLNKFLKTEEIDSDRIILGIPFYTRIWTVDSEGKVSKNPTVDMKSVNSVIPSGVEKNWKDDVKQYYIEYSEGTNKKQMWIEDIKSLKEKISLVKEHNLAGVASWQKGMESDDVWSMLKEELK